MKRIAVVLSSFLLAAPAHAASFDCTKASTKIEYIICNNPDISRLDENLATSYKAALQDQTKSETIKQAQKQWLKERNRCANSECVQSTYQNRIEQLHPFQNVAVYEQTAVTNQSNAVSPLSPNALAGDRDECERTAAGNGSIMACTHLIESGHVQGSSLASAYTNRGKAKYAKGDYDGALADHSRAIELDPKFAQAYVNRGIAKNARTDEGGAIADFNRAIEIDSKLAPAYFWRGNSKFGKSDMDGALADYTRAIELDSENAPDYYWHWRGLAKLSKGSLDGAIADFTNAIDISPKYAQAYYNRGLAKHRKGDLNGAIADYSRAVERDPKDAVTYSNRGYAKEEKGDLDGAIADCTRAVELDPTYAEAYSYRGIAKKAKGDLEGANADFKLAEDIAASLGSPK